MLKIKATQEMLIESWSKPVLGVMQAHFPDGMTVDDFMVYHPKAPLDIIELIFADLIQKNKVEDVTDD